MNREYSAKQPSRDEVDALEGPMLVEFGTDWCGFCNAAQPLIERALAGHGQITHLKMEDGPGRPLGRSFRVKLWPTLVFMKNGQEVARLVRPGSVEAIRTALAAID